MTRFEILAGPKLSASDDQVTEGNCSSPALGREPLNSSEMQSGCEWIIDAAGCDSELLKSPDLLQHLCSSVIADLGLQIIGQPLWHQFPEPGGVTGLYLLAESHLACHTWPEHRVATFNLFCCRRREEWSWTRHLQHRLKADSVHVRVVKRGYRDDGDIASAANPQITASGVLR